jgi:hypothetical protein
MTSALNLLGLEDNVNMNSNNNKVMTLADASGKEDSHIAHRWYGIATTQTKMSMTQQNHVSISAWKDESENHDPEIYDAAAFMNGDTGRNDFVLLDGDDLPQDDVSLTIDEFE